MMVDHKSSTETEYARYSPTYRAAEVSQVMRWIKAGQSGCLIGLRGAGKSNFLRFLSRDDVRQQYLGQRLADFALVHIDFLALTECADWAVYELILDRLAADLHTARMEPRIIEEIASLHRGSMRRKDAVTAQRAVERSLDIICQSSEQHIILVLDEFDAVFRTLKPTLFRNLRAMRDAHKGRVSYLIVVSDELAYLRDDLTELEHFCRLVSRNVCGLGPYNEPDARQMITYLAAQRSIELSAPEIARLVELSGGHAGLIKTLLSLDKGALLADPGLIDHPAVQAECEKVWASLAEDEQAALCAVASGAPVASSAVQRAKLKGLVRAGSAHSAAVFSPLFADFCRRQAIPSQKRVIIDRTLGTALIDGQRVELTELEYELLGYLYERRGQVCTKDELIANVYHQQYDRAEGGIDDARLQTLISRLRAKVEPPRHILTIRGEGYKFVEPGDRAT